MLRTYLGGHAVTTSYRLASIKVSLAGNMPVRTYALAYRLGAVTGLSCLESVTAIGADGKALELVRAAWQDVDKPGFNIKQPASTLLNGTSVLQTIPMDVDGDGITDIVQISTDRNGVLQATPFLASVKDEQTKYAAGTACLLGVSEGPIPDLPRRLQRQRHDGSGRCLSAAGEIGLRSVPVDWNGIFEVADHRDIGPLAAGVDQCLCHRRECPGAPIWSAYRNRSGLLAFDTYLSTPLGGGVALSATALTTVTQSQAPANRDALLAFDVNGDGMVDMVLLWNDRNQVLNATSFVSQGDQSASNGIKLFSKAVSSNLNVSTLHQVAILPADANGDGVVDLVQVSQSSAVLSIQSFLSDANGGFGAASLHVSWAIRVGVQPAADGREWRRADLPGQLLAGCRRRIARDRIWLHARRAIPSGRRDQHGAPSPRSPTWLETRTEMARRICSIPTWTARTACSP